MRHLIKTALIFLSLFACWTATAEKSNSSGPQWIWAGENQNTVTFSKTIELQKAPSKATLSLSCDNLASVFINGKNAGSSKRWEKPITINVAKFLKAGPNTLRVEAKNQGGPAGLIVDLTIDGSKTYSDGSWTATHPNGNELNTRVIGKLGINPWKDVFGTIDTPSGFILLPGFSVEKIYDIPKGHGSWVAMCFDEEGNLYGSDQRGGIYKLTVRDGKVLKSESVPGVKTAQGLTWLNNSLYAMSSYDQPGVHHITDSDGDGQLDTSKHIIKFNNGGEHGNHAIIPANDGKHLYAVLGNHVAYRRDLPSREGNNWKEDTLLSHLKDPNGHAARIRAPGGYVVKFSPDGKDVEVIAAGLRNDYDIALDANGELFGYDADMEWDIGTPWYRPTKTRSLHEWIRSWMA